VQLHECRDISGGDRKVKTGRLTDGGINGALDEYLVMGTWKE